MSWRHGGKGRSRLVLWPFETPRQKWTALVAGAGPETAGWPREVAGTGYAVLEAESGAQALALCAQHDGAIDLLLADILMPDMTGASGRAGLDAQARDGRDLHVGLRRRRDHV